MVAAKQNKARLDKSTLERLKKQNADAQAREMAPEAMSRFGDELVNATIQGFKDELARSPAPINALAQQFGGLIETFFKGFREGVSAELGAFVTNTRKITETNVEDIEKATTTNIKALTETVTDVVDEKPAPTPTPALTKEKTDAAASTFLARKEKDAGSILDKQTNLKDFLIRVGLGAIGQEKAAEFVIAKRNEKESFIQTETNLRSEEFKNMSSEDIRTKLEEDYRTIQTTTEELKKIEKQISTYTDMGYSAEQMSKLGLDDQKKELVEGAIKADPTRMSQYTQYVGGASPNIPLPSNATEENIQENAIVQERAAKEQSNQSTLLTEIRDLLKKQPNQPEKSATPPPAPTGGGFSLGGLGGRGGRIPTGGKTPPSSSAPSSRTPSTSPSSAGRTPPGSAPGSKIPRGAKVGGVFGAVATAAFIGADMGLGKAGVGTDEQGNPIKIDEKQDVANWDQMNVGEKLGSGIMRGSETAGKFFGVDNISDQLRADRINRETEYLNNKLPTIEDTKQESAMPPAVKPTTNSTTGVDYATANTAAPTSYQKVASFRADRSEDLPTGGGVTPNWSSKSTSWTTQQSNSDTIQELKTPGTPALDELAAGRDTGGFDQDVYSRAKRFIEQGGKETEMPRAVPSVDKLVVERGNDPTSLTPALDELVAGRTKGGFDQDVYSRAKSFINRGIPDSPSIELPQPAVIDRGSMLPRQVPSSLKEPVADTAALEAAAAVGKNITIQAPAPVVIPTGGKGGQQIMAQPFTNNIRNAEPTLYRYLSTRYMAT